MNDDAAGQLKLEGSIRARRTELGDDKLLRIIAFAVRVA